MTKLPWPLRYSPYAFYIIALIMGAYHFATKLALVWQIDMEIYTSPHTDAFEGFQYLVTSEPFAVGISEAAYMAANGVIAHLLIAIYDKVKGQAA